MVKIVNAICWLICVVCVLIGALIAINAIWLNMVNPNQWRIIATLAVAFSAASVTLGINRRFRN